MGNYSKFFGAVSGGVVGILVNMGIPAEWVTPEIQGGIVVLLSSLFTYAFPPNTTA